MGDLGQVGQVRTAFSLYPLRARAMSAILLTCPDLSYLSYPDGATVSLEACRTLSRQRWGRCTAYRMGIVVGEIGARIANPYRGRQGGLYREGIRRGRSAARETDTGQERPRRCWACGERTMGRVFGRVG